MQNRDQATVTLHGSDSWDPKGSKAMLRQKHRQTCLGVGTCSSRSSHCAEALLVLFETRYFAYYKAHKELRLDYKQWNCCPRLSASTNKSDGDKHSIMHYNT